MSIEAKGWFDSIKDTPLRDRIFVLMLFMNFLFAGALIYVSTYLSGEKDKEYDLRIKAERRVEILQATNLTEAKDCTLAILAAVRDCESQKASERALGQKLLEEKAEKLEQELNYLRGESRKLRQDAKIIKLNASR